MQRVRTAAVAGMIGIVLATACSPSEGSNSEIDGAETSAAPDADGDLFTQREAVTAIDDEGLPVEPVTESLPPVVETGVPGIESEDAFCRSWSRYAGSVQAISLAWALQSPDAAAVLEVSATSALSGAVAAMAEFLPTEIESNRQELTVDVPGPFLRRAERARSLLAEAGLGADQIDTLGAVWIDAITEQGFDSETLAIDIPAGSESAVAGAAAGLRAELPSVIEDPSLDTTAFDIGPSLDYITANCPDQGTLAGNDVIESGGS